MMKNIHRQMGSQGANNGDSYKKIGDVEFGRNGMVLGVSRSWLATNWR